MKKAGFVQGAGGALAKIAEDGVTTLSHAVENIEYAVVPVEATPKLQRRKTGMRRTAGGIVLKGTGDEHIVPAGTEVRPWRTSQDDHESQTLSALMVGETVNAYNSLTRSFEPGILKIDRRVNFMYLMTENANVNCANKDLKDLNVLARDPIKLNTLARTFIGEEALARCVVRGIGAASLTADTAVVITYGSDIAKEQRDLTIIVSSLYDLPKGLKNLHKYVPSREDQEFMAAGTLQRHVRARPLRLALLKGKRILALDYDWEDVLRTEKGDPIKLELRWNDGRPAGILLDPVEPYEEYEIPGDSPGSDAPEGISTFWMTRMAVEAFALQRLIPAVNIAAEPPQFANPALAQMLATINLNNANPVLRLVLKQREALDKEALKIVEIIAKGSLGNQLHDSLHSLGEDLSKILDTSMHSLSELPTVDFGGLMHQGDGLVAGAQTGLASIEHAAEGVFEGALGSARGHGSAQEQQPKTEEAISDKQVVLSTDPIQGRPDKKPGDEDYGYCARGKSLGCRQQ